MCIRGVKAHRSVGCRDIGSQEGVKKVTERQSGNVGSHIKELFLDIIKLFLLLFWAL